MSDRALGSEREYGNSAVILVLGLFSGVGLDAVCHLPYGEAVIFL